MSLIYKGQTIADTGGSTGKTYLVKAPVGTIVIWSGTAENIPTGWSLCDGQDGRPDLRDKFVLGAGETHAVGETGGEEEHTLTIEEMPSHSHRLYAANVTTGTVSVGVQNVSTTYQNTLKVGGGQPHNNMPPYYALCYIIKVTADETDGGTEFTTDESITLTEDGVLGVTTPVKSILTQSEYDALPPEEKNRGLYFIDEPDGETVSRCEEIYSTEEVRIGTWIDGKPLYRKTIIGILPSHSGNYWYILTDSVVDSLDTVCDIRGSFHTADGYAPFPYADGYTYVIGRYFSQKISNSDGVGLGILQNVSVFNGKPISVTIEYTKTTDTGVTA